MKIDITPIIKETRITDDVRILRAGIEALEMSMHGLAQMSFEGQPNSSFEKISKYIF